MQNEMLRKVIDDQGLKMSALADKVGMSRQSLYLKIKGDREFDQGEMMSLKKALRLSDKEFMAIFFGNCVDKLSSREEK